MLSVEDNELLVRVGPGTPMGALLRRFWLPALLEEEIDKPDGAPVRLRLLGEDLVAFRDTSGRIGVLEGFCAHRRASLFFGRNEECGIRCVYHGWKYDVTGQCVDMPSETKTTQFKEIVKIKSYAAQERGGVVWVYMGDQQNVPELPNFEWAALPKMQRTVTKRIQQSNWAQAVEGGIDSAHVSFLHEHKVKTPNPFKFQDSPRAWKYLEADRHPVFSTLDVPYGQLIHARRNAEPGEYYWRITQFLLPFYTLTPPTVDPEDSGRAAYYGHAWVPIDDLSCWTWSFHASPHAIYTEAQREFQQGRNGIWGPVDENYRPLLNRANDYMISRDKQRTDNFTGIDGIQNQDAALQESQGDIIDRSKERLGQSDLAIVQFRRQLIRLAKELKQGKEPAAAAQGDLYNVRPATLVLPDSVSVNTGARDFLRPPQPTMAK